MVRCEEFYKYFEKKGNFCNKSENVVKKVEDYIGYIKRNKMGEYGGYKISNCALDPFISIEFAKGGIVHRNALRELKKMIRKESILPEKVTRRVSIELINKANSRCSPENRLESIPGIRKKMSEFEHTIDGIGYEVRNMFDTFKKDIEAKNNNDFLKIILEMSIRDPDNVKKIMQELEEKERSKENLEIVAEA